MVSKMKAMTKKTCIYLVLLIGALSSCDYIKEDEVFIKKTIDTTNTNTGTSSSQRVAYIEYFTGHFCGNCPSKGADQLKLIEESYGDNVLYLGVHAGFFARFTSGNSKYFYNFKSSKGDALENTYKIAQQGTPQGMVNRQINQTNRAFSPSNWVQEVDKVSGEMVGFKIDSLTSFLTSDKIDINYKISASEDYSDLSTLVYLAEDSIVTWQKDYTLENQDVENYTHRYVLRDEIGSQSFSINVSESKRFIFSGSNQSFYNQKQLYVYVLVLKNEEVIQAFRKKL